MLANQQSLMKQQTEILNDNQKQLATLIQNKNGSFNQTDSLQNNNSNLEMMRALLAPINESVN